MVTILKRPCSITSAPKSTALKTILDCPDGMRVSCLEIRLPLLVNVAREDIVRVQICNGHCGNDRGQDRLQLIDD